MGHKFVYNGTLLAFAVYCPLLGFARCGTKSRGQQMVLSNRKLLYQFTYIVFTEMTINFEVYGVNPTLKSRGLNKFLQLQPPNVDPLEFAPGYPWLPLQPANCFFFLWLQSASAAEGIKVSKLGGTI